jgi:ketosteroid isomerase-like protein
MDNTVRFLDALERRDIDAAEELMAPDVTWVLRMMTDGAQEPHVISGRDQVVARLSEIVSWFERVAFADRRVSRVEGTPATFVQADGDFQTTDGRAYRNVYVFRFDWQDGKIRSWEEYANPVTIQKLEQGQAA